MRAAEILAEDSGQIEGDLFEMANLRQKQSKRAPDLVAAAVDLALRLSDTDSKGYVNLNQWREIKERLVALYPGLKSADRHAASGLSIAHNVRLPAVAARQIERVLIKQGGQWVAMPR